MSGRIHLSADKWGFTGKDTTQGKSREGCKRMAPQRDFDLQTTHVEKLGHLEKEKRESLAPKQHSTTRFSSMHLLILVFVLPPSWCISIHPMMHANTSVMSIQPWNVFIPLQGSHPGKSEAHKLQKAERNFEGYEGRRRRDHMRYGKNRRHVEDFQFLNPKPADLQIECVPLRSKRFFTDGFCTSVHPVDDHVCTGRCLPIGDLPWYAEYIKVWSRTKTHDFRCVDDVVVRQKIPFACDSGQNRTYTIPVVQSCKCKRHDRSQNRTPFVRSNKHRRLQRVDKKTEKQTSDERTNDEIITADVQPPDSVTTSSSPSSSSSSLSSSSSSSSSPSSKAPSAIQATPSTTPATAQVAQETQRVEMTTTVGDGTSVKF